MKYQKIILGILSLITFVSVLGFCITNTNSSIIGYWVSENDPKLKLVFTPDGKCMEFYDNEKQDEYTFSISNISPQCGEEVHVDQYTSYLKLVNIVDSEDIYCYEINGITSSTLSLRFLGNGGFVIYNKE
ncbi:hypothetical protein [Maribacter sp. 2304DJ31-5]|uniref:hypothetical protein n=1 Tax=Maribacter sp. 2304DJ31-5 TaxID=3386273 RepID=UPI0039BD1CC2